MTIGVADQDVENLPAQQVLNRGGAGATGLSGRGNALPETRAIRHLVLLDSREPHGLTEVFLMKAAQRLGTDTASVIAFHQQVGMAFRLAQCRGGAGVSAPPTPPVAA